jgi:hypothetical protein
MTSRPILTYLSCHHHQVNHMLRSTYLSQEQPVSSRKCLTRVFLGELDYTVPAGARKTFATRLSARLISVVDPRVESSFD